MIVHYLLVTLGKMRSVVKTQMETDIVTSSIVTKMIGLNHQIPTETALEIIQVETYPMGVL